MRPLVILRPEPGASATLARAEERGLTAIKLPLFRIEPVPWQAPDPAGFDGLLITSANAVRHGGPGLVRLSGLPAYAVGDATAAALRRAGFEVRLVGDGGVDRLLASLEPALRLLHLCGEHRHPPSGAERSITPAIVYRSVALDAPETAALAGAVAIVHSPRAGCRLAELVRDKGAVRIAAISAAAAETCGPGWADIAAADGPDEDALLSLAERLCKGCDPE